LLFSSELFNGFDSGIIRTYNVAIHILSKSFCHEQMA
jgi:hypothetical protein